MAGIAPGLDGFLAQRQYQGQQDAQGMQQIQGLLGIQQAMAQQQEMQKSQELRGLLGQKLQAGDMEGAKGILMQMKPELFAGGLVPQAPKWTATEIVQPDGTKKKGYVNINSPTPESTFRELGVEPVKQEFINGMPVNPFTQKAPVNDINKPFGRDANGAAVPNSDFQRYELTKAQSSRPITNISLSTEKKYGEKFAEAMAGTDKDMLEAARKAPALADRSLNIMNLVNSGKVVTGFGADYRLALGKALNLVGTDNEVIANTEVLSADLAKNTLDAINASGLGSGNGFSNADRDFLEKAAGGKITLEAKTIRRLAELSYNAASQSANKWNTRVKEIPASALEGPGISREPVKVSPMSSTQAPASLAPGTIKDGYKFKGGNPADKNNWEKL